MRISPPDRGIDLEFLEAAASIGRDVVAQAVWDGDRCNWVGAMPEEGAAGEVVMAYAALGRDLYGGTSGMALFLAHLSAAAGDGDARRTALGALRQALSPAADSGGGPGTVYTGRLGTALAAAEAGKVLDDGFLMDRAAQLAETQLSEPPQGEFDLLLGQAGVIVGLLILHEALGDGRLAERAASLGDELLERGRKVGCRLSWASRSMPGRHHLTGLSHGAAGAGYALLELARVTGESSYREAAGMAFAYERHVYDAREQNWPDYRSSHRWRYRGAAPTFATFWCHGAPGIALSRLRGYELVGDPVWREEAEIALGTTSRSVITSVRNHTGNFSLCHGLAGNAEVLLEGARVLGRDAKDGAEVARQVAEAGLARYGTRRPWPCGARGGRTPSLFLGLAGIGLFYLRLARPAVPSVLLLRPEAFGARQLTVGGARE